MPIDETAYRQLEEIGRRDGRVTTDDMTGVLPIQQMSPGDIAGVIERLEKAGVEVDVDEKLLRPHPGAREAGPAPGVVDAHPAAPHISTPGARPASSREIASMGEAHHDDHHHAKRGAPTWNVGGIDMLPMVCIGVVALVLIVALG